MGKLKSALQSRKAMKFAAWLERRVPVVREWHRFAYEEHFYRVSQWERLFHGVYPNFASAQKAVPARFSKGYDSEGGATFLGSSIALRSSDYPVLFWMQRLLPEVRTIFDFGGYTGATYWAFREVLSSLDGVKWIIYDVPAVVRQGERVLEQRPSDALSFTTEMDRASGADIFFASGSLQFLEADLADLLKPLPTLPRHLLISQLPVTEGEAFVTLHNMGVGMVPYRIFNGTAFTSALEALGYRLVDRWKNDDKACIIPLEHDRSLKAYTGLYFTRKAT